MERAAHHQAIDRRILSAFYTQYVAVLLIVLVTSISMFSMRGREIAPITGVVPSELSTFVGSKTLAIPFSENGQDLAHTTELEAIASTLQQHDLRATFRLALHVDGENGLRDILHKLELIRVFMQRRGVPSDAVRTIVSESDPHFSVSFDLIGVPDEF
jgi:hypothetical protein